MSAVVKCPECGQPRWRQYGHLAIDMTATVTVDKLVRAAANLRSEDGENPEYDRALAELIIDAAGLDMEDKDAVACQIRTVRDYTPEVNTR